MTIQTSKKRNAKSCDLHKTCCVCERTRYNTEFTSNAEGRTSLKPYCKHCKEIYEGIRKGLILERDYKGFDYNTEQLQGDHYGKVLYLKGETFEKVNVDFAVRLVKQGMAHVTSTTTIEQLVTVCVPEDVKGDISSTSALREHVFKRDNEKCHYCVRKGTTLDHVVPKFQGGLNTPLNLVLCCTECNELKANMSKNKFLTHLKQGDYDYFTQTWKPSVQIETFYKRCHTCGETKETIEFAKHEINCKSCEKIQPLLELGFVTKKQVKTFNLNASDLHRGAIHVLDKEGQLEVMMKKEDVLMLLERGIVTVIDATTVQRILSKQEEKRAYPRLEIKQQIVSSSTQYVTSLKEFAADARKKEQGTTTNAQQSKTISVKSKPITSREPISETSLDYIKKTYLTSNKIELRGVGEEPMKTLTQQQALNLVQKRIVHIIKANVVKFVMDEKQIQTLYPNFVFKDADNQDLFENKSKVETLQPKQEETKQPVLKVASKTKAHAMITKTTFTLSARDQFHFRGVPRETVISLVEQGIVKVKLKNQPRLPLTKDETLKRCPSLTTYLKVADFLDQLKGSCVGVFDQKNAIYATVPKGLARQLVHENYAAVVKQNRIRFTQSETTILNKFPALHQYKMYKEEEKVKLNAWMIKVTDSQSNTVKKIQLNEAVELAKEKKADVLGLNKIKVKELKNA